MSMTESNELPRRPKKIEVYGKHIDTTFLNDFKKGQRVQTFIEKIDDNIFELTTCVYENVDNFQDQIKDEKSPLIRKEFVQVLTRAHLRLLEGQIKEVLNQ